MGTVLPIATRCLVAIDPGLNHCGVALFNLESKDLIYAALIRSRFTYKTHDLTARVIEMARLVELDLRRILQYSPDVCVVELPQVYSGRHQKGDPNDLIHLAFLDGVLLATLKAPDSRYVLPKTWKGQVPKEEMCARIEGRLTVAEVAKIELCPASLRHNILDAIGIGLHSLGKI